MRHTRRPPRHRIVALAAVGSLALAACGADDGTAPETGPPVTEPAATGSPNSDLSADTSNAPADTDPSADTSNAPADTDPSADSNAPADTDPSADSNAAGNVPEILRVSAPLVGGGELDLATLGDRPVLLWFWSPF